MEEILTASQMKACDEATIKGIGIPSEVLMERASLAIAERTARYLSGKHAGSGRVLCVCGSGNNGGDGAACARILTRRGIPCDIFCVGNPDHRTEALKDQLRWAEASGVSFTNCPDYASYAVIVDAMLGTGLAREVRGAYAEAIDRINQSGAYVIAADIPSGISSDTGAVLGVAVRADETVTMEYRKCGQLLGQGEVYSGCITVAEIGILPPSEAVKVHAFSDADFRDCFPKRPVNGNKGTFGKVLLIAGTKNMCGAALLGCAAALRTGAGMVKLVTEETNRTIVQERLPEVMLGTWSDEREAEAAVLSGLAWCDVAAIGPGMGNTDRTAHLVRFLLAHAACPVVIDADGLNALSGDTDVLRDSACPLFITPHIGEMSRVTGLSIGKIQADPIAIARDTAERLGITCVLKDARTVTAGSDGQVFLNTSGNNGMATAGSGDTLTGILAAHLALGMRGAEAAACAVWLHGRCGDIASERLGSAYMTAGDIIRSLSPALRSLL